MFIFVGHEVVNEPSHTACGAGVWGMCTNGHESVVRFFNQFFWWAVEIATPDIRACVLIQIILYLPKSDQGLIFVTMFGITGDDVERISKIIFLGLLAQSYFDRRPIEALLCYETVLLIVQSRSD